MGLPLLGAQSRRELESHGPRPELQSVAVVCCLPRGDRQAVDPHVPTSGAASGATLPQTRVMQSDRIASIRGQQRWTPLAVMPCGPALQLTAVAVLDLLSPQGAG